MCGNCQEQKGIPNPIQDLLDQINENVHDADKIQDLVVTAFSRGAALGGQNILMAYQLKIENDLLTVKQKLENEGKI